MNEKATVFDQILDGLGAAHNQGIVHRDTNALDSVFLSSGWLTCGHASDNLIGVKTTVTEFQRNFRQAREAADRGDTVIVTGEHGDYVFERRAATTDHPFAGLDDVFGAVTLPRDNTPLREKVRRRLTAKDRRRRRRTA